MPAIERDLAYNRILAFENAMCRRFDKPRMQRYREARDYYSGENLPADNVAQPLRINYIQSIANKHTAYLFGEYDDDVLGWRCDPLQVNDSSKVLAEKITAWCYQKCRQNDANQLFPIMGIDGSVCGDSFVRARWDEIEQRVCWESIAPEYVHCRWNATNMARIEELVISYPMHRDDALAEFGTSGNTSWNRSAFASPMLGMAIYWEEWNPMIYRVYIDDVQVRDDVNPTARKATSPLDFRPGLIPLVHFPNFEAAHEFYGYSDVDSAFALQDELNRKLADEGDTINAYAHPITVINRYFGDLEELPVGPDQVWNLGREGEAKLLTWGGPAPEVHKYIEIIREIMLETASVSPVAYGRHKGTQQSAIALAIEMLPLTERVRRKRAIWASRLRQLLQMTAFIEDRNQGLDGFTYKDFIAHFIRPLWAPPLPRDRLALVNENIALHSGGLRTIERVNEDIGEERPSEKAQQIKEELKELSDMGIKVGGGSGFGSSSLPEGADKETMKGTAK